MTKKNKYEIKQHNHIIPENFLEKFAEEDREVIIHSIMTSYNGDIPPPIMLEQYEKILPGAAERFFNLVEKEQELHFKSVSSESRHRQKVSIVSIAIGFFSLCAILGTSIYFTIINKDGVAIALLAGGAITALLGSISSSNNSKK